MGAWGSGGFENDTALDWAGAVATVDDVAAPFDRLKRETDASPEPIELDADFASELIAAAECVAMMMGRAAPDFPEDLRARLGGAGEPEDLMFHQARNAVCYVLRHSELAELWEESADEGGVNDWHVAITGLIDRLNPEIEHVPWEPAEIEERAGGPVGACAFCDGPIVREELFGLNIHDYSNMMSISKGLWAHLPCLNARLHHKHAILDLKFDPDNLPDLDKL